MTAGARASVYCLQRAMDGLRSYPLSAAVVMGTIASTFFLIGVVHTIGQTISAATRSWQEPHMLVYLADRVTPEHARDIGQALHEWPAVKSVAYVSPEQAMARFADSLGAHDELLQGVSSDMLPASLEVILSAGVHDVAQLTPMVERLRDNQVIEDIEFAEDWTEQAVGVKRALHEVYWLVLFLVLVVGLYLVVTAIQARVGPRVEEAAIARLVGASSAFVRLPLVLEGALQGMLGAGLAAVGIGFFGSAAAPLVSALIEPTTGQVLGAPGAEQIVWFIIAGAGLGMAGNWLATRRYARI